MRLGNVIVEGHVKVERERNSICWARKHTYIHNFKHAEEAELFPKFLMC